MSGKIKILIFSIVSFLAVSFVTLKDNNEVSGSRDIVLQFMTYNGYGNNLYIDNVLTGKQKSYDITVTSFLNIPYDTVYSTLTSGTDTISPQVTVANIGSNSASGGILVMLQIEPGGYLDTQVVSALNTGQTESVEFSPFVYSIGTGYYLKAYTLYAQDSNLVNDTLIQYSISLPGYTRNVLYEEFTSDSSPACGNNNIYLNDFVNTKIQTVTAIKYHIGLLGRDTFYLQNPVQSDARRRYYYVNAVPSTIADGKIPVSIPYGDSSNLYSPYLERLSKGTPVSISVTDTRISGDSIRASINISILSALQQGNYRLRINAVERLVIDSLEGYFGEYYHYDVFREAFPDTNGFALQTQPGSYQYRFTYYRKPEWVDSMIYTAAFIQNDNTREVLNCAKGRNIVAAVNANHPPITGKGVDMLNVNYDYIPLIVSSDSIQSPLNVELFEGFFPPIGWKVFNLDGAITFQKFFGANGPAITGTNAVLMNFFDYNNIGQRDSMYSKAYFNLYSSDTVRFDYAYAQYNSSNIDSLIVKVSTDGGATFPTEIFRRGGLPLATAPQTTAFFIPTGSSQWRSMKFPLNNIVSIGNPSENIPSKFLLMQNYPNPFNPKTIIRYDLSIASHVTIKIYDITGREAATIVNAEMKAGSYESEFDGSNFASGIYFYVFTSDGFVDSKRMVLIK